MKYTVSHEAALEIHRVEIHQVDLVRAIELIDKDLYAKFRLSPSMADRCLALAMIVKAVEEKNAETPEIDDPDTNDGQTEPGTDFVPSED